MPPATAACSDVSGNSSSSSRAPARDALDPLRVLTCVRVVCRERAPVAALDHVAYHIDAFVCPRLFPFKSLDDAVECSSVYLLRRLLAEELAGTERLAHRHERQQQQFIVGLHIASAARRALQQRSPHMRRLLECLACVDSHALGTNDVVADAAATGDLELLEWLCTACSPRGADWIDSSAAAGRAAGNGSIHVLEWLVAHRWSPSSKVPVDEAVAKSQLAVLRWLEQQSLSVHIGPGAIREAATLGDLDMLAWLFARPRDESVTYAGDGAASGGHVHVLEWLLANHPSEAECVADGHFNAARFGHLDVLQWLFTHNSRRLWTRAMEGATGAGRLEIVQFLHAQRSDGDDIGVSLVRAAGGGHLAVVKFLYDRYRVSSLMAAAALSGNVELVKWLYEERSDIVTSVNALAVAAINGHLDLVKYLVSFRGGSSIVWVIESAARGDRMSIIEWIHAKVSEPSSAFTTTAQGLDRWMRSLEGEYSFPIDAAAENGNLAMIQWLEAHGYGECSTRAMDAAAERGHLEVIQYLHASRTEGCTTDAIDIAAANGHLRVVRWLHENRTEGCTTDAVDYAVEYGHTRVVAFLLEHRTEGCTAAAVRGAVEVHHDAELIHLLFKHQRELIDIERVRAHADGHEAMQRWLRCVVETRQASVP